MTENQTKHPLHGVGLKTMLTELVDFYDWDVLAEQIPLKCFSTYPSIKSSVKFLHKTEWARYRVEAFYLYRFKSLPLPSDEEHELPPRERNVPLDQLGKEPTEVILGDPEFFDDPISGPKMPSKKSVEQTRIKKVDKPSRRQTQAEDGQLISESTIKTKSNNDSKTEPQDQTDSDGLSSDPWAKWRK